MNNAKRWYAWLFLGLMIGSSGCTVALHENKQKYWMMKNDIQPLPCVDVLAPSGYISYPLLLERKKLFKAVSPEDHTSPVNIEVKLGVKPGQNLAGAMLWLIVSGSSAFLIPYQIEQVRTAEFIVSIGGQQVRSFAYEDTKSTVIWTLALPLLDTRNEEYFVEELVADQFVNSFIIDLLKDEKLVKRMRRGA